MPYENVPDALQGEMEKCVMKVKDKNPGIEDAGAIAICYNAVVRGEGKAIEEVKAAGYVLEIKESLSGQVERIHRAWGMNGGLNPNDIAREPYYRIDDVYPGYIIVCMDKPGAEEKYYRVTYTMTPDAVTFAPREQWREMEETYTAKSAIKIGQRNSAADQERLQQIHDYAVENGAKCAPDMEEKSVPDELLAALGHEIKATTLDDGSVKLAGYLVRFSGEDDPDVTGDFFTKDTDFGPAVESDVYVNHRLPIKADGKQSQYKEKISSRASLTKDDVGVFAEVVIKASNEYEDQISRLGRAGYFKWSSGTAAHLVERRPTKSGANEIIAWPLGLDASLTPTPAEPRNLVMPIKSLITPEVEPVGNSDDTPPPTKSTPQQETEMDETQITDLAKQIAKQAAEEAVKAYQAQEPAIKAGIADVKDEADRAAEGNPFKSAGEFFRAVKNAAYQPYSTDRRLLPLANNGDGMKANGLNEAIPSQGGFLVPPQFAAGIRENMYSTGTLLSLIKPDPIEGNTMTFNAVDETSRANGSRFGGLQGYWMAEAGTKTATKPKFRQIDLKLKKVAALCYATDELLQDATALESWLQRTVPQELRFRVEDAVINGDGVGKPLGILSSGALKSAVRTDASEIDAFDIGRMWAARWAGYNDYVWLVNQSVFPQLLNLSIGNQPVFLNAGGIGNLPTPQLLGRPVYELEYLPALGTLGDILLISPSAYRMIEKSGGVQASSSIHVAFTTDETAYRFVYRCDGQPEPYTTLTGKDGNTYSPFVALAAST